jgi:hypothetical protein
LIDASGDEKRVIPDGRGEVRGEWVSERRQPVSVVLRLQHLSTRRLKTSAESCPQQISHLYRVEP